MAQLFYDFSRALTVGAIFLVENHGGKEPKIEMYKSHRFSSWFVDYFFDSSTHYSYCMFTNTARQAGIYMGYFFGMYEFKVDGHTSG